MGMKNVISMLLKVPDLIQSKAKGSCDC